MNPNMPSSGRVDVRIASRDDFARLVDSCKSANLPKSLNYSERQRAVAVVQRARGWLKSSFFRIESAETQQHVAALAAITEPQS